MLNLLLPFSHRKSRRRWRTVGITLLLLYFLLFSIFSLFHAYAANELDGAHGCSIGQWIHLGLQAALFFFLVVLSTLLFDIDRSPALLLVKTLLWSDPFKRGPPRLSLSTC
ncbi:MAG: hypothetical protein HY282_16805 [Nitrospirae bacterium]|nr:hypothetical protein [Candidatus Manganitrophaceae bacterium]